MPFLSRNYAPSLAVQTFEDMSDAAFRPEQEVLVSQKEWAAGFGRQEEEAKRYTQALGTDASYASIVPGPVAVTTTHTTPTYASTATISNGDFETGDFTGWTTEAGTGATWSVSSAAPRNGTYAARWVTDGTATVSTLRQQITAADSSLFNTLQLDFSIYHNQVAGSAETWTLRLEDGNNTEIESSTFGPGGGYSEKTLSHTFTEGWPDLYLEIQVTASGANTVDFDDITITLTGTIATATNMGTVVKLRDFNGNHYAISETGLWKRSADNWVRVVGSPDLIEDMETNLTNLYLPRGTGVNYWIMTTAEAFTRNTGTGVSSKPKRMTWATETMYGDNGDQSVYKYNNLATGGVASTITVGEPGFNITDLVNHLEVPYVSKENAAYQIDSSDNVIEIMTALRSMFDTGTGKNTISWNGVLYIPAETQELMEYDDGTITAVGPNRFADGLSDFGGQVVATAGDGSWLYVILDNSTKVEILKGRRQTVAGAAISTEWRWHPFSEDTYTTVTYAQVSTITAKRLYYGGGTDAITYIPLSTQYADPLSDSNLTFLTGQTHETTWYELGTSRADKTLGSFLLQSDSLSGSARTVKVEYKKWGDSSWTEVGGSGNGTFNTTPDQEKFFQTGTNAPKTKKVKFQFTLNTNSSSTGLAVLGFTCYAILNPLRLEMIRAVVEVSDGNSLLTTGGDDDMTYSKVASQLHTWADTHPLTLTVPDGTPDGLDFTVKFAEGFPNETFQELGTFDPPHSPRSQIEMVMIAQRTS